MDNLSSIPTGTALQTVYLWRLSSLPLFGVVSRLFTPVHPPLNLCFNKYLFLSFCIWVPSCWSWHTEDTIHTDSPKPYNRRLEKTLPGLMSLDFCCDIQMVGSVFGIKNMKAWIILPCLNGSDWFKCHSLPEYCCWPCPSLYDYSVPIFWCYFQQDNASCHKAQIISDWFLEHDNEFTSLKWPPQSPDLNPIEHLWDLVEREIHVMDVQMTNLQQLRDAIMSIWTKISEECFQHLVESVTKY